MGERELSIVGLLLWLCSFERGFRHRAVVAIISSVLTVLPTLAGAELVSVGERNSQSYRVGVALGAVITLSPGDDQLTFNILPVKDQDTSPIEPLLGRIADFALVKASLIDTGNDSKADLSRIRGVAVLTRSKDEPTFLITREEVSQRQVDSVAKAVITNASKLMVLYEATASLKPGPIMADAGLELHQGVVEFYREEEDRLLANGVARGVAPDSNMIDAALTPATRAETDTEVGIDIKAEIQRLGRERDSFAAELQASLERQQSLILRLGEMEKTQRTAQAELEAVRRSLSQRVKAEVQMRTDLEAITQERDGAIQRLNKLERRVASVEFKSLEEASKVASTMRDRAELVETRYREAYEIGQSCLSQQTGGSEQARTALVQIERLEAELQQLSEDHQQCLAGSNR